MLVYRSGQHLPFNMADTLYCYLCYYNPSVKQWRKSITLGHLFQGHLKVNLHIVTQVRVVAGNGSRRRLFRAQVNSMKIWKASRTGGSTFLKNSIRVS